MIQVNQDQIDREREEYLEDVQIAEAREAEERKFKLKLTKVELAGKHKYKTIERFLVALAKCVPYIFAIAGVVLLSLVGKSNQALEDFLK